MDPFPGTCEIVEVREDLDSAQRLKESRSLGCGPILDDRAEKCSMQKMARKWTIEDDINKLFEAIDLRASATDLGLSRHSSTNSLRQSASKKPIRGGVSHASGIGISESVTLKQALRGLCISHASEIAAMKRLSKSVVRPSSISEVRAIKKLYRAVVVEANESGHPQDEGKGGLVEISFVPEQSEVNFSKKISLQAPREEPLSSCDHPSSPFAGVPTTEGPMIKSLKEEEIVPVPTETERDISTVIERHTSKEPERQASTLKLGKEGKPNLTLSLSKLKSRTRAARPNDDVSISTITGNKKEMLHFGKNLKLKVSSSLRSSAVESKVNKSANNNPCVGMSVLKSKCFLNKKRKTESVSACFSSNTCNADDNNGMSPSTSKSVCRSRNCNQNLTKESPGLSSGCLDVKVSISNTEIRANKSGFSVHNCNRANFDATSSECSRSREPAEFSQSSKSSVGEYSNSTCISEESHFCGFSCSGSRPHMSKDLRWDAIRLVEMQYGSLGLRHFKMLKRLGCGDVGTVYLAELTGTDCLFAVKVMDIDSLASKKKMSRAQTEREILQMLDHPFLPTLFAHFTTTKFSILVMEYCPGGDLHILRQKHSGRTFTEQAARFYVAEVLLALEYLHMLGIVYRDLKPENILVREDGHIMLSDFDLSLRCTVNPTLVKTSSIIAPAKKVSHPCVEASCIDPFCLQPSWVQVPCFIPRLTSTSTKPRMLAQAPQLLAEPTSARSNSFVGTHEYLAPEIIRGEGHGNAVDWWTFGIFLYELLYGTTPFKGLGNDETLANIVMHSIKFPESPSISSQAKDLIKGLLAKEPKNRFGSVKGAGEIKQHPFFEGLNWALIRCATPPMLPKSCDTGALSLESEEKKLVKNKRTAEEHPEFELF